MSFHATAEYLKYKLRAKTRHGIHSPFVYAFVEDVIQDRNNTLHDCKHYAEHEWLGMHYSRLLDRIIAKYNYAKVVRLSPGNDPKTGPTFDIVLLPNAEPMLWPNLFEKSASLLKKDSMILIPDIHKTKDHTSMWERICGDPSVLMSIDLYGVGLLVFKEEFKEQQHFVLKY